MLDGGLPQEGGCSTETGDGSREGTLCNDEGGKPELASAELALQSLDSQDLIEFWDNVDAHCNANPGEDCDPTPPPISGEQDKDGSVVPPAQESRASIPRLPNDEPSMKQRLVGLCFCGITTRRLRINPNVSRVLGLGAGDA